MEDPSHNWVWLQFGAAAGLSAGTWHHLVATYDWTTKQAKTYLNGVLEQSAFQPLYLPVGNGSTPEFRIGINSANQVPFKGGIDDVRVYHTVLSAAQVLQLKQSSELLPANTGTKRVDQYYDAFNRWVGSRVDGNGDLLSTGDQQRKWFVHDGSQVAAQFEATSTNAPALTHRYFWGLGVDELLADEKITYSGSEATGNTTWALSDHIGTVRDLIDNNGVIRRHSSYDSFGQVQSEQFFSSTGSVMAATDPAAIDTLFGYTGRAYDDATGLQNNLHRWYDAGVGRWASEDPIGFGGGDANLYRYVGNGITHETDSSGLAGDGHHLVPQSLWDFFGWGEDVRHVFDSSSSRIHNEWYTTHNFGGANGISHNCYNDLVRAELKKFLGNRKMTPQRAQQFVDYLDSSKANPRIRQFNDGIRREMEAAKAAGLAELRRLASKKAKGDLHKKSKEVAAAAARKVKAELNEKAVQKVAKSLGRRIVGRMVKTAAFGVVPVVTYCQTASLEAAAKDAVLDAANLDGAVLGGMILVDTSEYLEDEVDAFAYRLGESKEWGGWGTTLHDLKKNDVN